MKIKIEIEAIDKDDEGNVKIILNTSIPYQNKTQIEELITQILSLNEKES